MTNNNSNVKTVTKTDVEKTDRIVEEEVNIDDPVVKPDRPLKIKKRHDRDTRIAHFIKRRQEQQKSGGV